MSETTKLVDLFDDVFISLNFNFESAEDFVANIPGNPVYLKDTANIKKIFLDTFIYNHSKNIENISDWDRTIERNFEYKNRY